MPTSPLSVVIQHLRADLGPEAAGMTDGELLTRFVRSRDEDALAALVRRHAPMVWGVCGRLLRSHHDAEDAFQATFLVLVRKAAGVPGQAVANWLYGVARQTAVRLRATAAKRRRRETQVVNMPEPTVPEVRDADFQVVVDEELSRLPDHYRGVIVVCDLEGMTRKEAARQLGIPEGSVASRLARARAMLAKRLNLRGVVLSGSVAAVLSAGSASASAPPALVASTIKAASLLAAGQAAGVSVKVAALTEGVVKAMFVTKIKSVLAVVLVLGFVATAATLTYSTAAGQEDKRPAAGRHATREAKDKPEAPKDEAAIQGTWQVVALEDQGEKEKAKAIKSTKIRLAFTGNKLVMSGPTPDLLDVTRPAKTFVLNGKTSPKQIDITSEGWTEMGIYAFEKGQLKICLDRTGKSRPTSFTTEKGTDQYCMTLNKQEVEDGFTAWGKEINGLQAGVGFPAGQKRSYSHGETVTLVVRVRNVGKEEVAFQYVPAFFQENPATVTDAEGKPVPLRGISPGGRRHPSTDVTLAPGKEVELHEWKAVLRPASEIKNPNFEIIYGMGKFNIQYERVLGETTASARNLKFDPALTKLATGKLELEVNEAEKLPKKEKEGFTAWGKEINGLQAGLGLPPGEKRAYSPGETVRLVVRVRNVSKEEVKFKYLSKFLIEMPPKVTVLV